MAEIKFTLPSFSNGKTYLCSIGIIGLVIAKQFGFIPSTVYDVLLPIVSGAGLAALRAGVAKSGVTPIINEIASISNEVNNIKEMTTEVVKEKCKTAL